MTTELGLTDKRLPGRALMLTVVLLASCALPGPQSDDGADFQAFVESIDRAKADDYLGKPGVRAADRASFDKMKAYLVDHYRGMHVTHTFTEAGDVSVDCVPILEQPSIKNLRSDERTIERRPPSVLETPRGIEPQQGRTEFSARRTIDITLKRGVVDAAGRERFCRGDTIPIRRITLDDLVRFRSLEAFFHKGERREGRQIPGDEQHYYARGVQFVNNFGGDAWLNVWSPSVASGEMSLSQLWVVADTGDAKQTTEAGWQVFPDKWNSNNAALFIYYTSGGYKDGTGCYNLDCDGFKQVANNVYLGAGFDHYSGSDQTQWGFELQYKRNTDGNWWLFYRGGGDWIAVGYYPKSLFGNGKLSVQAEKVAFGGEDTGSDSAKQMGSGDKSDQHFAKAAYQNTVFYIDTHVVSQWATLSKEEPDPTCYTAEINNITGAWGTYLYFGGPSCN
jgi:neprosin-like protein